MSRKQVAVIAGAVPAFLAMVAVYQYAPRIFAHLELPAGDAGSRLAFVVHWLLLPGLTLLAGVVGAARRGFFADAIDGTRTPANHGLEINLRYNINTLEQVALAAIAWSGVALVVSPDRLLVIPTMAILFAVGRVTFWIGYLLRPTARAFGMVLTGFPTVAAFAWLGWRLLGG